VSTREIFCLLTYLLTYFFRKRGTEPLFLDCLFCRTCLCVNRNWHEA